MSIKDVHYGYSYIFGWLGCLCGFTAMFWATIFDYVEPEDPVKTNLPFTNISDLQGTKCSSSNQVVPAPFIVDTNENRSINI